MMSILNRVNRKLTVVWRGLTGYRESETDLGQSANRYWNNFDSPGLARDAHWRGHGPFVDDAVWLRLGQNHVTLLRHVLHVHGRRFEPQNVVEWGCGGGMNAVHFARGAQRFFGVDLSPVTLAECAKQMDAEGLGGFVPVLVDANNPRAALTAIDVPCDLFLCTYVMELLPSVQHAFQLLQLAWDVLTPNGVALIHIRCPSTAIAGRSRQWDYEANMSHNVTFSTPVFKAACQALGFVVLDVKTVAAVPELKEKNYAYFVLEKPKLELDNAQDLKSRDGRDVQPAHVPGQNASAG